MVDFGNTLKTLRLHEEMTQAQLSQKLGLTKSVISAYETGLRLPSYDVLIHIAQIFKVSTDYLLGVEQKDSLDLSGLTQNEKSALLALIKAMKADKTPNDTQAVLWAAVNNQAACPTEKRCSLSDCRNFTAKASKRHSQSVSL